MLLISESIASRLSMISTSVLKIIGDGVIGAIISKRQFLNRWFMGHNHFNVLTNVFHCDVAIGSVFLKRTTVGCRNELRSRLHVSSGGGLRWCLLCVYRHENSKLLCYFHYKKVNFVYLFCIVCKINLRGFWSARLLDIHGSKSGSSHFIYLYQFLLIIINMARFLEPYSYRVLKKKSKFGFNYSALIDLKATHHPPTSCSQHLKPS